MSQDIQYFIQLVFTGIIALFPVLNPVGSAFIVSPYFAGLSKRQRRAAIFKIAFYSFLLCTVTLFTGHFIMQLFGITVPIIQLAGGIMISKLGWESLESTKDDTPESGNEPLQLESEHLKSLNGKLFYPITFPITAGAGTISVIFTLSASADDGQFSQYFLTTGALLLAILLMCLVIYFCFFNANRLVSYLGTNNERIINRLMAFLIFCVGLQIAVGGIYNLIRAYR